MRHLGVEALASERVFGVCAGSVKTPGYTLRTTCLPKPIISCGGSRDCRESTPCQVILWRCLGVVAPAVVWVFGVCGDSEEPLHPPLVRHAEL